MIASIFIILCSHALVFTTKTGNFDEDIRKHPNWQYLPHDSCRPGLEVSPDEQYKYATTPYFGEFPWMALVFKTQKYQKQNIHSCAATIISPKYVLTTTYCCGSLTRERSRIRIGEYNLEQSGPLCGPHWCADPVKNLKIAEIIPFHKNFSLQDDICLIRTRSRIHMSDYIQPICLPLYERVAQSVQVGDDLKLVGWINSPIRDSSLLKVNVSVARRLECLAYTETAQSKELCVRENKEAEGESFMKKTCFANIGNIVIKTLPKGNHTISYAVGLLFGFPMITNFLCTIGFPITYTKLSAYTTWILDSIKP